MACSHPLKLFYTYPYENEYGVTKYRPKVCSFRTHHLEVINGDIVPIEQDTYGNGLIFDYWIPIPCGQCIECRLQHSREWANRLMAEAEYYDENECWFVTLTYNNETIPRNTYCDPETGKSFTSLSLKHDDITKFLKDLRYRNGKFRYYLCGEYGEQSFRPHYHAIIFGLKLADNQLSIWKTTSQGFTLFKSRELEKIWNKGNVLVSPVSWDTCCYVSRYVTKKITGNAKTAYNTFNLVPEFSRMSRRPGIGKKWCLEHPEQVLNGECYIKTAQDGISFASPRYFRNLIELDDEMEKYYNGYEKKEKYVDKMNNIKFTNSLARQDYMQYLFSVEEAIKERIRCLKRGDVY